MTTLNPKSPNPFFHYGPQNPSLIFSIFPPISRSLSIFNRAKLGVGICVPKHTPNPNSTSLNDSLRDRNESRGVCLKDKDVDVATLGNLCVDVVLNVPNLPPPKKEDRKAYMDRLAASSPDKQYWEAGGNCNVAIAAARLGLQCIAIGHVGNEIYGGFLLDVLHDEGIGMVGMSVDNDFVDNSAASYETLLCWVLVDPLQRHGFCSRADFSKEPAFSWLGKLSGEVKMAIKKSKILFCNGYGFDELSPGLIVSALEHAIEVGTAIFFDPGPRGKSLSAGTPEEQQALNQFLMKSDVLLLTSDEAETLTGIKNPILAGQQLLRQAVRTKWVIVKMGSKGSILITISSISFVPAFKVDVVDTVGCGDSFVAAIAFGFINSLPMVNTLAIANAVGAATAMGCGAGRNVASLERVMQLMRDSNLIEDESSWNELFDVSLDAQEVTILSKMAINGINSRLNHVSLQSVVSELLPMFESVELKGKSCVLKE
ncbi:Carbohydrate kinase [Parasponia andersonii]|uniref:Carbohydrate kinase n=1 Tax=Parasponia andersonii TaxID=3476 RepID=A0A2P5AN87_PARAD|nr:Carbohydrate kinase [Parasponia andersonii]